MNDPLKILVVDDDKLLRLSLRAMLEELGYLVCEACNGRDGLEAFHLEVPDLVLTDIQMPGMDGLAMIASLRESNPETPVVVLSGIDSLKNAINAIRAGAWDYIAKPASDPEELEIILNRVMETSRLRIENRLYQDHLKELVRERTAELAVLNTELEHRVQQRTRELEQLNKQLEDFTYSVSHDLRAPLRHIDGFSRALLEEYAGNLDETGRNYLDRVNNGCRRMTALIDDLLAYSRISRHALDRIAVDTNKMVGEVLAELEPERAGRDIQLSVAHLPPCTADKILLHQVFANLLGNAMKYTGHCPRAVIEVGATREQEAIVYYVRDNGAGFDMQYAGKLFGVFQRMHRAEEFEGTGVGLAIVQNIIQRHGGKIWAEAEVNKGATFYFTLG